MENNCIYGRFINSDKLQNIYEFSSLQIENIIDIKKNIKDFKVFRK